jgi:hypothetical protein
MPKAACALLEADFTRCTSKAGCCCWLHRLSACRLVAPKAAEQKDFVHDVVDEQSALCLTCLQVLQCQEAASGDTTKLLIQLQDGMQVEAVVMHYDTTGEAATPNGSAAAHWSSASSWVYIQQHTSYLQATVSLTGLQ